MKLLCEVWEPSDVFVDTHNSIPLHWHCKEQKYTVVAFCASARNNIFGKMVKIKYDGAPKNYLYSTTRDYFTVINDYKKYLDKLPIKEYLLATGHDKEIIKSMFSNEK
jgi:hypothetical protein